MSKNITDYAAMAQRLNALSDEKPVYIVGHMNTDYDSVCSCLALTRFLRKLGKTAFMLLEEKDFKMLDWFGDTSYILNENDALEKPFNIIQLDGNNSYRTGVFEKYYGEADFRFNIDHHEHNAMQADAILAISELSSTAEILCGLFDLFATDYDEKIASLLFGGMVSDTYSFLQRTTADTMAFAGKLLAHGVDGERVIKAVYLDKTERELAILKEMLNSIVYDEFHYIVMDTEKDVYKGDIYNTIFKKCIPTMQNIVGEEVLGLYLVQGDGINGEYRCNTDLDVAILASKFGGSGHKNASGFKTQLPLEEIIKITKEYIHDNK